MVSRKGQPSKLDDTHLRQAADELVKHGGNVSATAKSMGLDRRTLQHRLHIAAERGFTRAGVANISRWRPFDEIRKARGHEFSRVKQAGNGRTLHTLHMPDDGPYCLIALGDPHLDSPGTDLDLWDRWIAPLDHSKHIYALGLGDWLDSWVKPLQFLYGNSETPAPEGWILLEVYLDKIAPHMLASCSGNHDDWAGYTDYLGHLMAERGVLHRASAIRVALRSRSGRAVTVGLRHRFLGNSQWNPAHAVMKAAQMGWRDTLLIGGDKHVSGDGLVRCPDTGKLTWAYQVAAFKVMDDYGDQLGLLDKHVSPAVAFVIDPARSDTDPQLVTPFHEPEAACDYLRFLRKGT